MKKWYNSKTIWLNIIGLVIALAGELSNAFPAGQVAKISAFVLTIANIILRLLSSTVIESPMQPKK